jgi:hypothetical protein
MHRTGDHTSWHRALLLRAEPRGGFIRDSEGGLRETGAGLPSARRLISPTVVSGPGQLEVRSLPPGPGPAEADKSRPQRSK